jgi:hypothetical protein
VAGQLIVVDVGEFPRRLKLLLNACAFAAAI